MLDGSHVRLAADICSRFLEANLGADWDAGVPDLDFSILGVVAHAAEGCLWYAIDLAARGEDLTAVEHRVRTDGNPGGVVETMVAYAEVAASVVDASPESARGFHPMGMADPSGFAAMACDELLIHTDDAARGLGEHFSPPNELAALVLGRLFPWVSTTDSPWEQLRWANGRIILGDRARLDNWAWHCAPISDWDGTVATRDALDRPD